MKKIKTKIKTQTLSFRFPITYNQWERSPIRTSKLITHERESEGQDSCHRRLFSLLVLIVKLKHMYFLRGTVMNRCESIIFGRSRNFSSNDKCSKMTNVNFFVRLSECFRAIIFGSIFALLKENRPYYC
jgi:hypothetical protein